MDSETDFATGLIPKGSILKGPYWPEPVRVLSAQMRNQRIEIHAVGLQTERYFSSLLDMAEFQASVQMTAREAPLTFAATFRHFRLSNCWRGVARMWSFWGHVSGRGTNTWASPVRVGRWCR